MRALVIALTARNAFVIGAAPGVSGCERRVSALCNCPAQVGSQFAGGLLTPVRDSAAGPREGGAICLATVVSERVFWR